MAYQALYRKYRPNSFSYVYGQQIIVKTLKNIIKNDKLSHAYLFTGPRGTGKTSTAKLFAKAINCLNNKDGDACNECKNCISYNENSNPDIIEIDAASNNGVDEIREIRNNVNLVPSISKYKVYIIDEVHMLSIGAFNALLKTLEEPPKHIIFILATTEPQKMPVTVISRCQRFDFKNINNIEMKNCLENIVKQEKINISNDAIVEIINTSDGGMRDAIGLLDQANTFCDKKVEKHDIEELTGNVSIEEIYNILSNIIDCNINKILNITDSFSKNGKDISKITKKITFYLRKMIIYKKTGNKDKLTDDLIELCNKSNDTKTFKIIDTFLEMIAEMKNSYDSYVIFEIYLIKLINELSNNNNVLIKTTAKEEIIQEKNNVPRGTLNIQEKIEQLKDLRINNILLEASKGEIKFISDMWQNITEYLINDKYKISAGLLKSSIPVAASKSGILVTFSTDSLLKKAEKNYDNIKLMIEEMCNQKYKMVFITAEKWKKIRPEYAKRVKNNELNKLDENKLITELKKIMKEEDSTNDFVDLIEMEEK